MQIPITKIREALESALRKRGVDEKMIAILAEGYLEGELQGKQSHGLMAFPSFLEKTDELKGRVMKILKETHAMVFVDADRLPGAYVGRVLADQLLQKAATEGVATGYITNMRTWLRPGSIAEYIAHKGMIGFVINNGGVPMIAPPGGYDPVLGTNPIGIGIPSEGAPVLVDMATSKRAWGEARKAKRFGTDLPEETFYTKNGEYAVHPDDAYSVEAMGGYKGFALTLFIEIMTGSFLGRSLVKGEEPDNQDYQTRTRGAVIIVFDPSATTSLETMKKENAALLRFIKQGHQLPGVDAILVPGERGAKIKAENLNRGYLEVDDTLWKEITI